MKKWNSKKIISLLSIATIVAFTFFALDPDSAFAAGDAWKKAGISPDGSIENSGIYDDLDSIIYLIMAVGGFWVIACLLFAGMKLSAAQGNPQMRTQGFVGLAMAAIGLFIIVKAYDIAGFIAGFGG